MSDRISIPALRETRVNTFGHAYPIVRHDVLLALVEVAEAAQKCLVVTEGKDGDRWVSLNPGGQLALHDALARFDFGEET